MDDGILLHESKEVLQAALEEMKKLASQLKLEFNRKTQISPLSQGVDYLGFRFYLTDTGKVIRRLRTESKRRFKRRLKRFRSQYAAGEKDYDAIKRSLASYRGHLSQGHTWKLNRKVMAGFSLTRATEEEREESL